MIEAMIPKTKEKHIGFVYWAIKQIVLILFEQIGSRVLKWNGKSW